MRILIVSQYFYPENFRVNNLAKELVERGNEVTVLTGYPQYPKGEIYDGYGFDIPYEKNWNGVRIERVKMKPRGKNSFDLLIHCYSFVKEGKSWVKNCNEKFDAVYVFEVSPVTVGLPAIAYKQKFGAPIFFNVQDLWPENVIHVLGITNKLIIAQINKIVDKIYWNSNKILCTSKNFVKHIKKRGVPDEKLIYWPQFCDMPDFSTLERPQILDANNFNIVYTGNIGTAQGLDLLIEALKLVPDNDVHCYFVGSGRELENLKLKVVQANLDNKVHFVGQVSEHEANEYVYYANASYISLIDNFVMDMTVPAKLQTYLACGTPIIGAVSGESAEIIKEANAGICVNKDAESIVGAINQIKAKSSEEVVIMRKDAGNYFNGHFNKDKLVDELLKLMEEER